MDTNTVLRPLLQGLAIQPDFEDRIGLMSRTLLSRPNLEKLMRMTDLDLQVTTEKEKDEMIGDLAEAIRLAASRKDPSLYSISVEDPDRDTAKRVAQALITVFIESSLSDKRGDTTGAQGFLESQINEYQARLIAAETRIANFMQQNSEVVGGRGNYYRNLNSARDRLKQAELKLREQEKRKEQIEAQLAGEEPLYMPLLEPGPIISAMPVVPGEISPIDQRIMIIHDQLSMLSMQYTDRHPTVRQLMSQLEELETEKQVQLAELAELQRQAMEKSIKAREEVLDGNAPEINPAIAGLTKSPVYMDMRNRLSETEAQIASLQVRVKDYQQSVADLESKVTVIPEVEGQLSQMNRDVQILKSQHSTLLKRRELARLGQDVEQKASGVTFRVIDPPYVPLKPSEPDKILLNGLVLVVGLAGGVGAAFLLSLIHPVFFDTRSLVTVAGLPVLGSVSISQQSEELRKERFALAAFTTLTVGLVLVYAGMTLGQSGLLWS